mgnify:CR=1 FL=1
MPLRFLTSALPGSGAARNITRMRLNSGQIDAIFLTHFHSDHIDGLGELLLQRWGTGNAGKPVPIYGPQGLDQVVQGLAKAPLGPSRRDA